MAEDEEEKSKTKGGMKKRFSILKNRRERHVVWQTPEVSKAREGKNEDTFSSCNYT